MHYDPIKHVLGDVARKNPVFRKLFYFTLGMMFLRTWFVKRQLRELLSKFSGAFSLYDAGSGFGQYSYYIAKRFPQVNIHAVDVKDEQIVDCRDFFSRVGLTNTSFAVEDLTIPHHTDKFDFILSVDVMEHIPDDVGVFRNFYQALRKNGMLLINTPSNLGGSDADSDEDESFIGEHARNGYSVEDITEKLTGVGFSIHSWRYTYGPAGSVAWRFGIKYPMMMLNTSKAFFIVLPFYYLLTLWFVLALMWIDYRSTIKAGTGLQVVAVKH